jgi:hypothetical protein
MVSRRAVQFSVVKRGRVVVADVPADAISGAGKRHDAAADVRSPARVLVVMRRAVRVEDIRGHLNAPKAARDIRLHLAISAERDRSNRIRHVAEDVGVAVDKRARDVEIGRPFSEEFRTDNPSPQIPDLCAECDAATVVLDPRAIA